MKRHLGMGPREIDLSSVLAVLEGPWKGKK